MGKVFFKRLRGIGCNGVQSVDNNEMIHKVRHGQTVTLAHARTGYEMLDAYDLRIKRQYTRFIVGFCLLNLRCFSVV